MTLTLCESVPDTLTNRVWDAWKNTGIHSRFMSWLELHKIAEHFLKLCKEQERDYREFDFYTLVDSNLNYYENKAEIENELGQSKDNTEKEAANKLKDYLTEDNLKEYSDKERSVIEELQQDRQKLNSKLSQLIKKQENQTIDPEALKHEIEEMNRIQTLIYAKLEQLPNLESQISALLQSEKFKDLGKALQPIKPNVKEKEKETNLEKPGKPKLSGLCAWVKKKQIKLLDALAGVITTVSWIAVTGYIVQIFGLSWALAIGLSVFWLFYIVVFRLMIGGLLD